MSQGRRYRLSKTVFLCSVFFCFCCAIYINYRYIQLVFLESDTGNQKSEAMGINYNNECFRARRETVPNSRYGKLNYPFINLGFPKIGSSSIHSFFGCAGYRSAHYRCSPTTRCSECIQQSVHGGLLPFHHCVLAEVYSQIDDGRNNFPQIDYMDELVNGYPNATFLLAFRSMDNWYHSLTKWTRNGTRMDHDLMEADIKGFPSGMGQNIHEFSTWFCNHVNRVRDAVSQSPTSTLVEIDLDDEDSTRQRMSDIFNVDASCWGRANANLDVHPELSGKTLSAEGQSKWFLLGNKMIKAKDGTRRKREYPGEPFLSYL